MSANVTGSIVTLATLVALGVLLRFTEQRTAPRRVNGNDRGSRRQFLSIYIGTSVVSFVALIIWHPRIDSAAFIMVGIVVLVVLSVFVLGHK